MNLTALLVVFALATIVCACIRIVRYECDARRWRREKKNFRLLRTTDVIRFALPKAVITATGLWITVTDPTLALLIATSILMSKFQRAVDA